MDSYSRGSSIVGHLNRRDGSISMPEIKSLGGSFIGYLGSSDEFNSRYSIVGDPKHRDGALDRYRFLERWADSASAR